MTSNSDNGSKRRAVEEASPQSPLFQPISPLVARFLDNPVALKSFLSFRGGSILYCLSALSILYGIAEIVTPVLAKSKAFSEALPCIVTLNIYELALLGVLVTIVVWKNVTDDAISLVVLVALFLITSGTVLGTGAYHAPKTCLYIGLGCTALGLGKLYAMRRFISFAIGKLSVLGMTFILLWNFLTSSVISGCFASAPGSGAAYREHWLAAWMVLLVGAGLIVVDAGIGKPAHGEVTDRQRAFLHRSSMVWIFMLIVIGAAYGHQYGIAYMYNVKNAFGDYIPLIGLGSFLGFELMRSLQGRSVSGEVVVCCLPLASTMYALLNESIIAGAELSLELLWYPPVMLGLTGLGVLWLSIRHRRRWLGYVVVAYALGSLLTVGFSPDRPCELNWHLCGGGVVAVLLVLGVVHRNAYLCLVGVIVLAGGLGTTEAFVRFAKALDVTCGGAVAGVVGVGSVLICLGFGRKVPRIVTVFGTVSLTVLVFDYLGKSLAWKDIPVAAGTGVVCTALWLRTRDIVATPIVCIPLVRKLYLAIREMSAWGFVVLSFVLLFAGAAVSLFCKQKKSSQTASEGEPPER